MSVNKDILIVDDNINNNMSHKGITKKELYPKERSDLLNKLNNILGITDDNNIIYIYDIDSSIDKQKQINDLVGDIKKYFKCGTWSYFAKVGKGKRQYLSLIKSIYKDMGYNIYNSQKVYTRDNKSIKGGIYVLCKV
jgi:hypothetical protein